jgi:hypothetical protein
MHVGAKYLIEKPWHIGGETETLARQALRIFGGKKHVAGGEGHNGAGHNPQRQVKKIKFTG